MQQRRLGRSALCVSDIAMGTMTFGSTCDEATSHAICDMAFEAGINFFDAAEVYPVPPKAETVGDTEIIFGRWLSKQRRDAITVATKVTGPAHGWFQAPVRDGRCVIDRHTIMKSCDECLRRLRTDYIDLYQIHWPDHGLDYAEVLGALTDLRKLGKVRAVGCSNETSWGVMKSLWRADQCQLDRYETIQNNFSLINRRCENELAQVCRREGISLLPYSPLGGGVLTGKYQDGPPTGARFTDYLLNGAERQQKMAKRFVNERTIETTARLMSLAAQIGTTVTALAVAWSRQHDFVASTIVGANSTQQLEEILAADELILDQSTLNAIDQIELDLPNPMTEDGLRRL
ncbi:MAG: aldo/keto reductase [Planctomycetota bacterium]